jgi:hypothetical protein
MSASYAKVTMLDSLPELEDYNNQPQPQQHQEGKYQKFIREGYNPPSESGMNPQQAPYSTYPPPSDNYVVPVSNHQRIPIEQLSCMTIAGHVENCPICSRFYNNDKTLYIIIIAILAIICILLLKKILDI